MKLLCTVIKGTVSQLVPHPKNCCFSPFPRKTSLLQKQHIKADCILVNHDMFSAAGVNWDLGVIIKKSFLKSGIL